MSPPCRFLKVSEEATRNPSSCEAKNAKFFYTFRNLSFDRSTTEDKPLYLTSFTEKNRPKAKEKDTVNSFPKTGKQHLTLWPATHLPRNNHQLLWAAIMHMSHWTLEHGRFCVQLCIETLCKRATSVAHLTNFFVWFLLCDFQRRCPSTFSIPWCKNVKNGQKLKSRGPALKFK